MKERDANHESKIADSSEDTEEVETRRVNVSDHNQVMAALQESEQRLRDAQAMAHIGSWELNLATNALWWSDETYRIFEIDAAVFGASYDAFLDAIHPEDRDSVNHAYTHSLETRMPYEISHRLRMADGRIKHVHECCKTYYTEDGRPQRSVGTVQDVTARVVAEERARELDAGFAIAFHGNPIAMGISRLRDDTIVEVNAAAEELFGRRREDMVGTAVSTLDLCLGEQQREPFLHQLKRREPIAGVEAKLRDAEGQTHDVSMTLSYLTISGESCALASFVDVTERRLSEARVRKHLVEKETLLREIHHRVKNNLQVIAGLLHFQAKKLHAPEDVAALAELRQRIFAMTLLHERLYRSADVARIIFGEYVRALVGEQLRSLASGKNVRIQVVADEVQLPIELAMPSGLIVNELVTNVLKYAFPGSRTGSATVTVGRESDHIVLTVEDEGVGFPDDFDPSTGGAFGWEMVRSLVAQLDGTVGATNASGAHVRVSFPAPASPKE